MPATSQARIDANRKNALKSTGPRTEEGKARSRANAYKHGLTGSGVVLPEADALAVERKAAAYQSELKAEGEVGRDLARRAALLAVRMDRSVDQQSADLAERVRRAEADFEAPEGVEDPEQVARLRAEAGRRAMFNPSPEATMARKYEAAAERGYYRALKELRQLQRPAKVAGIFAEREETREMMGSFFDTSEEDAEIDAFLDQMEQAYPESPASPPVPAWNGIGADVPFTIGRA